MGTCLKCGDSECAQLAEAGVPLVCSKCKEPIRHKDGGYFADPKSGNYYHMDACYAYVLIDQLSAAEAALVNERENAERLAAALPDLMAAVHDSRYPHHHEAREVAKQALAAHRKLRGK